MSDTSVGEDVSNGAHTQCNTSVGEGCPVRHTSIIITSDLLVTWEVAEKKGFTKSKLFGTKYSLLSTRSE